MDAVVMGLILAWVMLAVLLALGYGLFKRYGRVLIELEELKHRLASPQQANGHEQLEQVRDGWPQHAVASVAAVMGPNETPDPGLPMGAPAPSFTLSTLAHRPTPLSLWRGRPVLLLFVRPAETGSQSLLKRLAQMTTQPSVTSPTPVVVMLDDSPAAHAFIEATGVRWTVVTDASGATAWQYRITDTPAGYVVDEHGRIASERFVGAAPLLGAVDSALHADQPLPR